MKLKTKIYASMRAPHNQDSMISRSEMLSFLSIRKASTPDPQDFQIHKIINQFLFFIQTVAVKVVALNNMLMGLAALVRYLQFPQEVEIFLARQTFLL